MTKSLGESVQTDTQARSALPRRLRIMVVDDDRDSVATLKTLLGEEGHEVWGVYRAGDVKLGVQHFDPDVVLLDIGLPDGSGYALAQDIRAITGKPRPVLIALTGLYREGPDKSMSKAVGFDHFITKPYDVSYLLKVIAPLALKSASG
jgi:DNA-binding response OmpR family regulator